MNTVGLKPTRFQTRRTRSAQEHAKREKERKERLAKHAEHKGTSVPAKKHLLDTIMRACAAAEIIEPDIMAQNLIEATLPDMNTQQVAKLKLKWTLPTSTMSDRLRESKLHQFFEFLNLRVANETIRILRDFPPDPGTLTAVIDPHQENLHIERIPAVDLRRGVRVKRKHPINCPGKNHRCQSATVAHTDNKTAKFANDWLRESPFVLKGIERLPATHSRACTVASPKR